MQLTLQAFHAFSQGNDIRADLKAGWCAGITGKIGLVIPHAIEGGHATDADWFNDAYNSVKNQLTRLAASGEEAHALTEVRALQSFLQRAKNGTDICGQIHTDAFNRRQCRVAMSVADWVPVLSHPANVMLAIGDAVFKTSWSVWQTNHVGLLVRSGAELLLFDPNYGVGRFRIGDDRPLTLPELTEAIAALAWEQGYAAYWGSCTVAKAVLDEDGIDLRFSLDTEEKLRQITEFTRGFGQ